MSELKRRKLPVYAEEFKSSSAKLAVESEQSIAKTAEDLGINKNTLHGWIGKYYPNRDQTPQSQASDAQETIKQLKKALARVRQERDILKKAAAYFASEMA